MNDRGTLVDLLEARASSFGERRAFTFSRDGEGLEEHLSFAELVRRAEAIASRLRDHSAWREPVLILAPSGLDYLAAFLGCAFAGALAVPAYPPHPAHVDRAMPRLKAIVETTRARIALTTRNMRALTESAIDFVPEFRSMVWLDVDRIAPGSTEDDHHRPRPSDAAFIQFTSGTTGRPRGIVLTHVNIMENLTQIAQRLSLGSETRVVSWLPPFHDMGLGFLLGTIHVGGQALFFPPAAFMQRPARWLESIARFRGNVSGAPSFAYDLCARRARSLVDLSSWRTALVGADPIDGRAVRDFAKRFGPCGFPATALRPAYGLAESTFMVSVSDTFSEHEGHVSVGRPLDGTTVLVVDAESGRPSAAGKPGEVRIRGPSVAERHLPVGEAGETRTTACLEASESPVRTGDIGFFTEEGELVLLGRSRDVIHLGDRHVFPHHIEWTVDRAHGSVRPGCSAAFSVLIRGTTGVAIVVEVERRRGNSEADPRTRRRRTVEPGHDGEHPPLFEPNAVVDAVRQAIEREHKLTPLAIVLLRAGSIAKTTSGKVRRQACREQFFLGTLPAVSFWPHQ
jgi:acyl-CoA synthetase (AMP-forming)/AMP-acid ligase II